MKIRVPKYFNEFKCIADKCEDTCCAGWEVVIDEDAYEAYQQVKGSFGDRLRSEIVNDGEDNIFVLKNNNCPFLNGSKLCDIYSELGEDYLCYTCQQFPRYTEEFGNLREVGISLSCPEAARIILGNSERVEFEVTENDEFILSDNEIDGRLYMELMQCRQIIFQLLQNRNLELKARAILALAFMEEVQQKIDNDELGAIKFIKDKYLDEDFICEASEGLNQFKEEIELRTERIYKYFDELKDLKHINDEDPLKLKRALKYFDSNENNKAFYLGKYEEFYKYYDKKMYKFENILVYFVFRYFMKAVYDGDALGKIQIAIFSYLMIKELCIVSWIENDELTDEDIADISHIYSKDVEHLVENIDTLEEAFYAKDIFSVMSMITILASE